MDEAKLSGRGDLVIAGEDGTEHSQVLLGPGQEEVLDVLGGGGGEGRGEGGEGRGRGGEREGRGEGGEGRGRGGITEHYCSMSLQSGKSQLTKYELPSLTKA